MKIFIDGKEADIESRAGISISLSVASLTEFETNRTGYSKTVFLPMTSRNIRLMGDAEQVNSSFMFNGCEHSARIEKDGCTVIEGALYLAGCEKRSDGSGYYRVNIVGPGGKWIGKARETPLRDLGIDFSAVLTQSVVLESWTWSKPVRFLPVERKGFAVENAEAALFPPAKILAMDDYHPFIRLRPVLEKIFGEAGYGINSRFIAGDFFGSLHMSGNYSSKDTGNVRDRMDFRAGRFFSAATVADYRGRVYANPLTGGNTIGNIVDTADPREENSGVTLPGVYTVGDHFGKSGGRIVFTPPSAVVAAFEYSIYYTTEYYMLSRRRLAGFDRINLGESQERSFELINRNVDRKEEICSGKTFMFIVFDHEEGETYQLRYNEITNPAADPENLQPGDYRTRIQGTFSSRSAQMTITSSYEVYNPQLYVRPPDSLYFGAMDKDWAMYDGYVQERGEVSVEMVVRSTPETISPSNPKYFDRIYFGGAEEGMKFVISKLTSLRPVFVHYPTEGSTVGFYDVAAHSISCLELINAVKHLFNLCFYTDELSKTVFIEPRRDFYSHDVIVDWSDRVDLGEPIVVGELGGDMSRRVTFRYGGGDDAVSTWNRRRGDRFGSWSASIDGRLAAEGEKIHENKLFAPSVNVSGDFPDAPAASLLQAGYDTGLDDADCEMNFPAKIVRYCGLVPLESPQRWGWPSYGSGYPYLAFHSEDADTISDRDSAVPVPRKTGNELYDNGFTLCFEDRNGHTGLHRYYDWPLNLCNNSKRVELYLMLSPQDVEPFISPNRLMRDFRALFRLRIDGENALFRIEEICGYDPSSEGSTRCIFVKEI